ncbi:ACT domain-containing protein ACR1-like [Hibiscus syriacus]|uniref:ACT domain-containing protein ACR1-like n=1 Tax=Hibiscus syriacus TaxID=106335 RepID=UPI0019222125|nr:ACT domain-containing protein ACR1-like [Hibiscus syriacus]
MEILNQPYVDPEFESLVERINDPRVCIDNDTCSHCTVVKVDSANRHGILLEMVQVLTDLDLVISKSYICSDGVWLMDVFHVRDQLGKKITDETLTLCIQQELCDTRRRGGIQKDLQTCLKRNHASMEHTALEITGRDRPGLMSDISAALYELECHIIPAVAWTHNGRMACLIQLEDGVEGGPITVPKRLAQVQEKLESVTEAHHENVDEKTVRLTGLATDRIHTERWLHQLMYTDRDYKSCRGCTGNCRHQNECNNTHVTVGTCREKGYSVVNVRSRDRNKLLFDTVCAFTDMQYVIFHAAVSLNDSMANHEYFIRRQDGCSLVSESESRKLTQCLITAIKRRVSLGSRVDISSENNMGLLWKVTRVFREKDLSISRMELGTHGEKASGCFYVTDASGNDADSGTVESVKQQIGGSVLAVHKSSWSSSTSEVEDRRCTFSLGNLLWSLLSI